MKYVLFVCNHNAGRSQMAQAFFERHAPADVRAESAGITPAAQIWPVVVEAMREVGIDIASRRPKRLVREMQLHADWAITMGCGDVCPYVPTMVEAWDIPDPAGRPLDEVRAIRDGIEEHVRELVDYKLDAIRNDPTAHQFRLTQMLPALAEELACSPADASGRNSTAPARMLSSESRWARTSYISRAMRAGSLDRACWARPAWSVSAAIARSRNDSTSSRRARTNCPMPGRRRRSQRR